MESTWTGDLFIDSVLNQGREEDQRGKRVIPPVRWASDPSYKDEEKTIITYSFATTKSKFDYGETIAAEIQSAMDDETYVPATIATIKLRCPGAWESGLEE